MIHVEDAGAERPAGDDWPFGDPPTLVLVGVVDARSYRPLVGGRDVAADLARHWAPLTHVTVGIDDTAYDGPLAVGPGELAAGSHNLIAALAARHGHTVALWASGPTTRG